MDTLLLCLVLIIDTQHKRYLEIIIQNLYGHVCIERDYYFE